MEISYKFWTFNLTFSFLFFAAMSSFVQPLTVPNELARTLVLWRIMIIEDVHDPFFVIEDEDVAEPKSNSAILHSKSVL